LDSLRLNALQANVGAPTHTNPHAVKHDNKDSLFLLRLYIDRGPDQRCPFGLAHGHGIAANGNLLQQSRRQDAQNSLLQLHLKQLQWRGLHPQYSSALAELAWPGTLTLAGHYSLSLQSTGTQGYVMHATAIGLQARDTPCRVMSLRYTENSALLKTSNGAIQTDLGRCWKW
jgi:hypothetical protein